RRASGLDQTGLSQKGGPVVSDILIAPAPEIGSVAATTAGVDLLLVFDLLGGAAQMNLATANWQRTRAAICTSVIPTGPMATQVATPQLNASVVLAAIDECTRAEENVRCDARALAEAVFEDHMPANMIMLGVAWQQGSLPVSLDAIEHALRLNGVG